MRHSTTIFLSTACVLVFVGLIALLIVMAVLSSRRERERRAELTRWAGSRGWAAVPPGVRPGWVSWLPGRGRLRLQFSGPYRARPASAADYSYTTSTPNGNGGTTTATHHFCAFVVHTRLRYPNLLVHTRGAGSKLWRHLTGPGHTELGHTPFDEQYKVVTNDPPTARRLLTPALVQAHLAGYLPDWHLQDQDLLTYHQGRLTPTLLEAGLARTAAIADLIEPQD